MPRPEVHEITFSIDGREVRAPENAMLVDAAKHGDVEIPVFCYEPKLGQPVGACRMCLVEVEGIPKLQTACSTPVKDGMVVHTQTERVRDAQKAVVEFLLINHPLDCPVCDKGGECPLQDITYGWGPGTSRFIEPKRHFEKPLYLSPLIAIDRERCILCYRCVRFSQEVSEDYQLILQERGADTYVATFDGHPYVAPFSGNITELCPVGALTNTTYRFRARPWDIEGAGSVCTMCPSQCNVQLTVRDEKVMRVMARDNVEVDDGWLCDKGRYAYQSVHSDERLTTPLVREGGGLSPASWEKALDAAASALKKAGPRAAAVAGGHTTNEEAFLLQRLFREHLGSSDLTPGLELPLEVARALANPALTASVADLEFAHAVLVLDVDLVDEAPIIELRVRKGIRRRGVRLAVASARPTALDPRAETVLRFRPGTGDSTLVGLDAALRGDAGDLGGAATAAGSNAADVQAFADFLAGAGEDIVIVYGERSLSETGARALLNLATRLGLAGRPGAGLLGIPMSANGRGLREAGFAHGWGPGYGEAGDAPAKLEDPALVYLLDADPVRFGAGRAEWLRLLGGAQSVIAHARFMTDTLREHADVVFPAEAYPEKEGTVVHPDGRVQRLRASIGHPGSLGSGVRATWQVIADVAARCGFDLGITAETGPSQQLFSAVPFYRGLSLESIGGKGVRWPELNPDAFAAWDGTSMKVPRAKGAGRGLLRVGLRPSLWASDEVEASPSLEFLRARQVVEMSAGDAGRRGIFDGDRVEVGGVVEGTARVRAAVPDGTIFLIAGAHDSPGNLLSEPDADVVRVATNGDASAVPVLATPAAEGLAEMPPSAPLDLPPTQASAGGAGRGDERSEAGPS